MDEDVDEDVMADNAVGHGGIKTDRLDSKEAQRSHFVVTPWVGLPSTSVLEATDIDQNVTQSLFLTQFDHFHFHPTLELKSRVILRRLCHIKPGRNNCCNRHIPVLAISLPRPRETGCLESISIMMVINGWKLLA